MRHYKVHSFNCSRYLAGFSVSVNPVVMAVVTMYR